MLILKAMIFGRNELLQLSLYIINVVSTKLSFLPFYLPLFIESIAVQMYMKMTVAQRE